MQSDDVRAALPCAANLTPRHTPGWTHLNASTFFVHGLFLTREARKIPRDVAPFTEEKHGPSRPFPVDADPVCRPARPPHRPHPAARPVGHRRHRPLCRPLWG